MSETKIKSGWGWPLNSKKAHYFADSITSLCRRWMYSGPRELPTHASPDDCAACVKALANLQRCPSCGSEESSKKPTWCKCNEAAPYKRVPLSVIAAVDAILPSSR